MNRTFASLFSGGIDGLGVGFRQAGFRPLLAADNDPICLRTLRTNNPSLALYGGDLSTPLEPILTDYEIKRANMPAEMGYAVFAADLFGAGVRPPKVEDKRQHTGELYKDRMKMRDLMNAAPDTARGKGANIDNAVAMGYCFGGAAVLELARSGADLKGFATFHGGLKTPTGQDYASAKGEILVVHGSADTAITMDQFATLTDELEKAGVRHQMVTYSGAPHAFTVFGSERYREDADRRSWALFSEFLREKLQ